MSLHRKGAQPIIDRLIVFPALDRIVVASREQIVLNRMPLHKLYVLRMPTQNGTDSEFELQIIRLAPRCEHFLVIRFVNVHGLVSAASGQVLTNKLASKRPVNSLDFILVILQLLNALEVKLTSLFIYLFPPNASRAVKACACEQIAMRTPAQVPNRLCVTFIQSTNTLPF